MIFGLSPAIAGLVGGVLLGLVSMATMLWIAGSMEDKAQSDSHRQTASLLRKIAWLDVILFGAVGYFVGPMLFS